MRIRVSLVATAAIARVRSSVVVGQRQLADRFRGAAAFADGIEQALSTLSEPRGNPEALGKSLQLTALRKMAQLASSRKLVAREASNGAASA